MSKSRTELAAVWPPTAAVVREAGHAPMSNAVPPRGNFTRGRFLFREQQQEGHMKHLT
jgi:hypothetical protein